MRSLSFNLAPNESPPPLSNPASQAHRSISQFRLSREQQLSYSSAGERERAVETWLREEVEVGAKASEGEDWRPLEVDLVARSLLIEALQSS